MPRSLLEIFPVLKPLSVLPGEVIYAKGDISHDLVFLIKGAVEALSSFDGRVLYTIA